MREYLHRIVDKARPGDTVSRLYDHYITLVTVLSLVPLMFKELDPVLYQINNISVYLLFMDYVFRWMTYDYECKRVGDYRAFLRYPFTIWAVCDLLAIMPTLGLLGKQFRLLRLFRIVKLLHNSKTFLYVSNVFKKERKTLSSVLIIALAYIYISALAMFCYEPDTFDDFFEALYWATTALTTVGYGDVYPVSSIGRLISMLSSLFGIAVIALPAGIVTAGFMDEYNRAREEEENARKVLEQKGTDILQAASLKENSNKEELSEIAMAAKMRAMEIAKAVESGETPDQVKKEVEEND